MRRHLNDLADWIAWRLDAWVVRNRDLSLSFVVRDAMADLYRPETWEDRLGLREGEHLVYEAHPVLDRRCGDPLCVCSLPTSRP